MVEPLLLSENAVEETLAFYSIHARDEVLYPNDPAWVKKHLNLDFFLMGIKAGRELVAVAWAAYLKDFVYFSVEDGALVIKNDGSYAYSGGWCIRPDHRGAGLFQLLTAAVNFFWFDVIPSGKNSILWGRMVGKKDANGSPLFWNQIGERITGLSYEDLRSMPFGTAEQEIFERWPKKPVPLGDMPADIVEQALGKMHEALIGPYEQFLRWGWVSPSTRYVPTSLSRFFFSVRGNIPDARRFFDEAVHRVNKEFGRPRGEP